MQELVQGFRGLKPPRYPSVFEALINAITCQQISLTAGLHVLNRLIQAFGEPFPGESARPRPSPGPGTWRGRSLRPCATGVTVTARPGPSSSYPKAWRPAASAWKTWAPYDEAAVKTLSQLRGIGRWTAEYALLRGLGRTHLFPGDDVGARHKLETWLDLKEPLDYPGVQRVLAGFQPFGGLIYFHFLLGQLAAEGQLGGSARQAP